MPSLYRLIGPQQMLEVKKCTFYIKRSCGGFGTRAGYAVNQQARQQNYSSHEVGEKPGFSVRHIDQLCMFEARREGNLA